MIAALAIAFVAGVALFAGVIAYKSVADPNFVFLRTSYGAHWIREARPMEMALLPEGVDTTVFEKRFTVIQSPPDVHLRYRALESAAVYLDGVPVGDTDETLSWKQWHEVEIATRLSLGNHTLRFVVQHENGPPLLQAYSEALGQYSDISWQASRDGQTWAPAATVDQIAPVPGSRAFPRSDLALIRSLPLLAPIFLIFALLRWAALTERLPASMMRALANARGWSVPAWRIALIAALAVLGLNNLYRVPFWFGFDVVGHMEYIHYIVQFGRIPLAPDGWKMNEAPLFHLLSAIPYRLIYSALTPEQNIVAMRVIPIACGLLQVEIAFRTLRLAFPSQAHAQSIGITVCALLPMNIYLSQFVSNQPLVGVLSALAVYLTLRLVLVESSASICRDGAVLGLVLGLAVLSKITALLMVPGALLGVAYAASRPMPNRPFSRTLLIAPAIVLASLALVSGWYFVRNQVALGTPFSVGFSESLDTVWRQDPGFRAPGQFALFGESLLHPIHACFVGYWDSIYSTFWSDGMISSGQIPPGYTYGDPLPRSVPPWDFVMLGAATMLSVVPMALITIGAVQALIRPTEALRRGTLLSLFWIGTHLVAMIYLYLSLPTVSAGKAAYLLNLLPCIGLLAAQGATLLTRRPLLDALVTAAIAAWALASYGAFFAR